MTRRGSICDFRFLTKVKSFPFNILKRRIALIAACVALMMVSAANGQTLNNMTSAPMPGSGHDYIQMLNETVNPSNGSVSLRIEVPVPKGRGLTLPFAITYNSNGQHLPRVVGGGNIDWINGGAAFMGDIGWSYSLPLLNASVHAVSNCSLVDDYVFRDPRGGHHRLGLLASQRDSDPINCADLQLSLPFSVEQFFEGALKDVTAFQYSPATISDYDGTVYQFPRGLYNPSLSPYAAVFSAFPAVVEDRNGNKITITDAGNGAFSYTDTLGRTVLSASGYFGIPYGQQSNTSYLAVAGLGGSYTLTWAKVPFSFAGPNAQRFPGSPSFCAPLGSSGTLAVVTAITLPNGKQYQFEYDPSFGFLSRIIYPSGGWVRYDWGWNPLSEAANFVFPVPSGESACAESYDSFAVRHRYVSFDGTTVALQQDFDYSTNWDLTNRLWTSKTTTITHRDLLRGVSSQTIYTYSPFTIVRDAGTSFYVSSLTTS